MDNRLTINLPIQKQHVEVTYDLANIWQLQESAKLDEKQSQYSLLRLWR